VNNLETEIAGDLLPHYKKRNVIWWMVLTGSLKKWELKIILNLYDRFHAVGGGMILNEKNILDLLRLLVFS